MTPVIPILLYHSVHDEPPEGFGPWAVNCQLFVDHMDTLVRLGYTGLSFGELVDLIRSGAEVPPRTVVVTFDDGFADFESNAWPVLKARSLPVTLYVTAGTVGGRSEWLESVGAGRLPMLDAAAIRKLADDGVEIGAHSMTHPQLDCIGGIAARREIADSKRELEALLQRRVDTFAYPHGYHDRAVKQMVIDAGYTSAAAVRNVLSHPDDDPFAMARYTVMADCSVEHLESVLAGAAAKRARPHERWRTCAWRQVRRLRAARTRETTADEPVVVSPVPREKWRSILGTDAGALPEHAPEWIDALTSGGRYRDASRLYSFADGRELLLPLVRRRGLAGLGGWLQSYPPGWGIGGLVGAGADPDAAHAILKDLRRLRFQRIGIWPDPKKWETWAEALDEGVLTIPRRAHVVDLSGGIEKVWNGLSQSSRRHIRIAEREGVRVEMGHTDALLRDFYSLYLMSIDRWAGQQHEPRALAHARAKQRDPLSKLQLLARNLGKGYLVSVAYIDGRPAAGSIVMMAGTAHYTLGAMDRGLVGKSGAGYLVQWKNLERACELGCTTYHMGESGESEALAQFKEKLGAVPYDYAELRLERLPWTRMDGVMRRVVKRILGFKDV